LAASEFEHDPDVTAHRLLQAWRVCGAFGQIISTDEPIAILCLLWVTPRATSAGLLATDRWPEVAKAYSKHCDRVLKPKLIADGVRRIEARTWDQHEDARRWLTWLGAKEECRLPEWGANGETFIQYGWTADVRPEVSKAASAGSLSGIASPALDHRHVEGAEG
jgi:hypothetical protein